MRYPSYISVQFTLVTGFATCLAMPGTAQGPLPDIESLMEHVRLAAEQRDRLLENAWGTCNAVTQRGKPACELREDEARAYLPADEEANCWTPPRLYELTWYRQGIHRRDDSAFLRRAWDVNLERGAQQSRRSIDLEQNKGYLDHAPNRYYNLINLPHRFDLDDLLRRPELDPLSAIERQLAKGNSPRISWSLVDETPCIQVAFEPPGTDGESQSAQTWEEYHFAPGMNFALVRATIVHKSPARSPNGPMFNIYRLAATYIHAPDASDVWLCSTVRLDFRRRRQGIGDVLLLFERIQARFSYAELGGHLSADTFTFTGLGLPPGAPIYDLRVGGIQVLEDDTGFVVHPEDDYLFAGLPRPIPLEIATEIVQDLREELKAHSQAYIHAAVKNRVEAPTIHGNLYRRLALERLEIAPGDATSILRYAFNVQDDALVNVLVAPLARSHGYSNPEPSKAAMDLVERVLVDSPEALLPLHVEALHLSADLRKPGRGFESGIVPIGYDRAMVLLCGCLERGNPKVQAMALRYLPGRAVRTQTSFDAIKATLQGVVTSEAVDSGIQQLALEKLRLIEDFVLVR